MDNKKWYNRFSTIFWWCLTVLPLIIALIYFIGYHFTFNSGITSASELSNYHSNSSGLFLTYLDKILTGDDIVCFDLFSLDFTYDLFFNLFNLLGLDDEYRTLISLFAWMTSVQFYHLIFDFIVWLPKWFHAILEKGFDKLS